MPKERGRSYDPHLFEISDDTINESNVFLEKFNSEEEGNWDGYTADDDSDDDSDEAELDGLDNNGDKQHR